MALAFVLPFVLLGCGLEVEEPGEGDELVGSAEQADVEENALAPNALAPNALAPNALAPNALAPNALAP
ncbi:MAG: hypothetical protein IT372_37600, partial [Polyangiaceae bacterium]|nr:hypothetical protein [Polyangiaceae bacterium]